MKNTKNWKNHIKKIFQVRKLKSAQKNFKTVFVHQISFDSEIHIFKTKIDFKKKVNTFKEKNKILFIENRMNLNLHETFYMNSPRILLH